MSWEEKVKKNRIGIRRKKCGFWNLKKKEKELVGGTFFKVEKEIVPELQKIKTNEIRYPHHPHHPHTNLGNEQCLKLLLGVGNTKERDDLSISLIKVLGEYVKSFLHEIVTIDIKLYISQGNLQPRNIQSNF